MHQPDPHAAVAPDGAERRVVRSWVAPWIASVLVAVLILAAAAAGAITGVSEGHLVNGDEAVAALLPVDLARGQVSVLFPGNSYQGILEVPVYGALWQVFGADAAPMRLFHQLIWMAAVMTWTLVTWTVLGRGSRQLSRAAKGWSLLAVLGLLGVTSVPAWPVWFRIYPGYHVGALLAGLAVLLALHARRTRWWFAAGLVAGLAIYAQPMHVAGAVAVAVLALCAARSVRLRWLAAAGVGVAVGASPLLLWNLRNGFASLESGAAPVQHPEWTYVDRLANTARITTRVLWEGAPPRPEASTWVSFLQVGALLALLGIVGVGAVHLLRSWQRSAPLLAAVGVMLLGLPMLSAFSLDVDSRYAVAWWPALVVLVATGAGVLAGRDRGTSRIWGIAAIVIGVAAQVLGTAWVAVPAVRDRSARTDPSALTRDVAHDLQRCGVEAVEGDYWAVYPILWGSEAELDGAVPVGMERLAGLVPTDWSSIDRIAMVGVPGSLDLSAISGIVTDTTGRGENGWTRTVHPETGTIVWLEGSGPFPDGCIGVSGLQEVSP